MARKKDRVEDMPMAKLLEAYTVTKGPGDAPHERIATVLCWRCDRPNVYDGRRPRPTRCIWCRAAL